jgi:DNA repair protein RadC
MNNSLDVTLVKSLLNFISFSPLNDVKATQLIERYTSIEAILVAPIDELGITYGLTPQHIQHFRLIRTLLFRTQERRLHDFSTLDATPYLDYIKLHIAHLNIEGLFVVLISSKKKYIHSEVINTGCETSASLPINTVVKLALNHNAKHLILAHNHPTGSVRPSYNDIATTQKLNKILLPLNIHLIDHVIVSPTLIFSILSNKLLIHLSNQEPKQ